MIYSLVIPHFDDVERLERLLISVPWSREDIEVIVVDDCSSNQVDLELLRDRWPNVRWLSTTENSGAGVSRNVGLDAAVGRWLIFADSDDELLPTAFEKFDRLLRDDDELVYFLAEAVQEVNGSPSIRSEQMNELVCDYSRSPGNETLQRLKLQHVVPWAKVYSRVFIQSHRLRFDAVRRSNDVAFNVLAAMYSRRVRVESVPVYRVYRRAGSLTSNVSADAFIERFMVDRSLAKRLAEQGIKKARSATGYMLLSTRYGPKITLYVCWMAFFSPMLIEWGRFFDIRRWRRFVIHQRKNNKEQV